MTPDPQPRPAQVVPAAPTQPQVTVTSSPPDSTLANKVDFDALDGNHDGQLSRAEAGTHTALAADFRSIDADHNGQITRKELAGGK